MRDYKPFFLAERMETRILIGLAAITATIIVAGWVAINENARMEEFTERANARSIEAGARIFESNCSTCHGADGRGIDNRAPALNSPHLFGYDYFADIDNQILLVEDRLANSIGEEREEIQSELNTLQAERLALEETLLYDYSDRITALDEELAALDAEIVMLEGVDNASRLPAYISQREIAELQPLQTEQADLMAKGEPTEEQLEEAEAAAEGEAVVGEEPTADDEEAEAADEEAAESEEEPAAEAESADEAAADEETEAADEEAVDDEEGAEDTEAAQEAEAEDELTVEEVLADYPNLTGAEAERFIELEAMIAAFEEEIAPYQSLSDARAALVAQRGRFIALADAQEEAEAARMALAEAESALAELGEAPEEGEDPDAAQREELLAAVNDARGDFEDADIERIEARTDLLTNADILDYDPNEPGRLEQVGWAGSLDDFVEGTLTGGRPTSSSYWPEPMVAWSQVAGGPLRVDQISNLVDYILNWNREFTIEDLREVRQFARVPGLGATAAEDALGTTNVGLIQQGVTERLDAGDIDEGDAALGEALFVSPGLGCSGCHTEVTSAGPARVGLWSRVEDNEDDRLTATGYEEEPIGYVIQSIVEPGAFLVPGFGNVMPDNFSERLGYQDLVHILAYLETQE